MPARFMFSDVRLIHVPRAGHRVNQSTLKTPHNHAVETQRKPTYHKLDKSKVS